MMIQGSSWLRRFRPKRFNKWWALACLVGLTIANVSFQKWNTHRVYGEIYPWDLTRHHYPLVKTLLEEGRLTLYKRSTLYPPVSHYILALISLPDYTAGDFTVESLRRVSYDLWFILVALKSLLVCSIVYLLTGDVSISILAYFLSAIEPINSLLLFRWYGFAQFLGLLLLFSLTLIIILALKREKRGATCKPLSLLSLIILLVTAFTHSYSFAFACAQVVVFSVLLILIGIRERKRHLFLLSRGLITAVVLAGILSFLSFYKYYIWPTKGNATVFELNKAYTEKFVSLRLHKKGELLTWENRLDNLLWLFQRALLVFPLLGFVVFEALISLIENKHLGRMLMALSFLIFFACHLMGFYGTVNIFMGRAMHYWVPSGVILFSLFIKRIKDGRTVSPRTLFLGTGLLFLIVFLNFWFFKRLPKKII